MTNNIHTVKHVATKNKEKIKRLKTQNSSPL